MEDEDKAQISLKHIAKCIRAPQIEGDIKHLKKKFKSVERDLVFVERLLEAGQVLPQTDLYPGFGEHHYIYKTRVVNTSSGKGKSSGYRLIYEELDTKSGKVILLILLYDKNTFKDENRVRTEVKTRLKSPQYPKLV